MGALTVWDRAPVARCGRGMSAVGDRTSTQPAQRTRPSQRTRAAAAIPAAGPKQSPRRVPAQLGAYLAQAGRAHPGGSFRRARRALPHHPNRTRARESPNSRSAARCNARSTAATRPAVTARKVGDERSRRTLSTGATNRQERGATGPAARVSVGRSRGTCGERGSSYRGRLE